MNMPKFVWKVLRFALQNFNKKKDF